MIRIRGLPPPTPLCLEKKRGESEREKVRACAPVGRRRRRARLVQQTGGAAVGGAARESIYTCRRAACVQPLLSAKRPALFKH